MSVRYRSVEPNIEQRFKKYFVRVGKKTYPYDSLEDARLMKKQLMEKGIITGVRGRPFKNFEDRFIQKTRSGKYEIIHKINGKSEHFGTFTCLEDAREERDYFESIGWDWDEMD